jgi:Abnormal spindle-like microcephaly-assoc'd, ASPM-SPD-2-Hydin
MRLPQSIRRSLSVRVIQLLTFGFLLLCVGVVPLAVAKPSQLVYNDSDVKFGAVVVGQTATLPVTVTNSAQSAVTISGVALSNAGFSTSPLSLPLVLQAGQSFAMNVTFVPPALGWTGGTIKFATDGSSSAAIQVEGTGVSAEALSSNPSAASFGQVAIGTTSSIPVVLTNLKHWKVNIQALTATGSGFSVSGPALPMALDAGQSVTVIVAFTPQTAGVVAGSLFVSGPRLAIPLSGSGATPGQLVSNPGSLNFANIVVGTSQTQSVTLTNSGSTSVTVSQATVSGNGFTASGLALPLTLGAGQSATLAVVFAPQSAGSVAGNIAVISNASNSTLNLPLSGSAVAAGQLMGNPSSLSFGSVQVGATATLTDALTNTGGSSVTLSGATVTGAGFSISGLSFPLVLNPGASVTFNAVFAPQSGSNATGSISVTSNASNSSLALALSGTGTAQGQLTLAPTSVNFGNTTVGTTVNQTANLTASGAAVTVSSASVSGAEFSLSGIALPVTIPAGQSVPVTMTFAPQSSGAANAVVSVTSNASNSASQNLSGMGVAPPQHNVALSWTDSGSGVAGYKVYRGGVTGGPYAQINSGLNPTPTYSDTSVTAGQTYYYVTTAVDGSGVESAYSNETQGVVPTP